jgi:hypothetical protein
MKLIIASTRSNDPEVHAEGCADVMRGLKSGKYQGSYTVEVDKAEDAALDFWSDIIAEESMTEDDAQKYTKYLPCTRERI